MYSDKPTATGIVFNFNYNVPSYDPTGPNDFDFGAGVLQYSILASIDNDIIGIWADSDASLYTGMVYISDSASFSVVNLEDNVLYDYYAQTASGRYNDHLVASGIVDITISPI